MRFGVLVQLRLHFRSGSRPFFEPRDTTYLLSLPFNVGNVIMVAMHHTRNVVVCGELATGEWPSDGVFMFNHGQGIRLLYDYVILCSTWYSAKLSRTLSM